MSKMPEFFAMSIDKAYKIQMEIIQRVFNNAGYSGYLEDLEQKRFPKVCVVSRNIGGATIDRIYIDNGTIEGHLLLEITTNYGNISSNENGTKVEGIQVESDFIYIAMTDGEGAMINKSRVKFVFVKEKGVK